MLTVSSDGNEAWYNLTGSTGTKFPNIAVKNEPYNRQNILIACWGDRSANESVVGFYHDRFQGWYPERWLQFKALMDKGELTWSMEMQRVLSNPEKRQRFIDICFAEAEAGHKIDYIEVVEFTNVSNGYPCYYIGSYSKEKSPSWVAPQEKNVNAKSTNSTTSKAKP